MKDKILFVSAVIFRICIITLVYMPVLIFTNSYFVTLELVPLRYYIYMIPFMYVFTRSVVETPEVVRQAINKTKAKNELIEKLKEWSDDIGKR